MTGIAKVLELAKHMRVAFAKRDATHLTAAEKSEMDCGCTHEIGDSACDAHPSCASCGEINNNTLLIAEQLSRALIDVHADTERMRAVLDGIRADFDRAVVAHDPADPRHRSHGGQHHNGPCCAFGNLNPSAMRPMRQWIAAIDSARRETK